MAKVPTILVVDENEDSRVELRKLLTRGGLTVAGEARYGASASAAAHEFQPDAVVVGIEDPPNRALETVEALSHLLLETPILGYSTTNHADAVRRALRAGVRDYLSRPLTAEALRESIFAALEQEEQRQLRRAGIAAASVRGSVVTVTGAKGGVGKSIVAINLALALRQVTGRTVLLLDADTHFGDVATMLNIAVEHPVTELLRKISTLNRISITEYTVDHASGISVLPGPRDPDEWRVVSPENVKDLLDLLAEAFDFVVVDTPDVFDPLVEQCVMNSTLTLVVTSVDISSIADTKSALRLLERRDCAPDKLRLTLNYIRARDGIRESDVEEALSRPVFWSIPYDKRVPDKAQVGESLLLTSPKLSFSRSFVDLARTISGAGSPRWDRSNGARRRFGFLPVKMG